LQKHNITQSNIRMQDTAGGSYELLTTVYTLPEQEEAAGTIVFLHDSLGCIALWRDFPEQLALAAGYHAFIYDRRGYGGSSSFAEKQREKDYMEQEAEVLMELLEHCGIKDPVLFGHSDGGTIALLAAAKYPGQIKAVITEGAHVFVEGITIDGIEQVMEQFEHSDLPLRLARYHGDKTQAVFDAWTKTWLADFYRDWNIEHFLPQITCPVYVVQGEADEFGTIRQVQSITGKVSGPADHFLIPNAGHSPHKQAAYFLIQKIVLFLEQQHLI
jgi:pimeloyl-ACP methyl ester carboxylesterase